MFQANIVEKIKTRVFYSKKFLKNKIVPLWDKVKKYCTAGRTADNNMVRMRTACYKPKATNTHTENVILIAFPPQGLLNERASQLGYT
jgi:hypothetical protein